MLSVVYHSHNTKVLRNKKLKVKVNFIVEQVVKPQITLLFL